MNESNEIIEQRLKELHLHYTSENLEEFIATRKKSDPRTLLADMSRLEITEKARRAVDRRLKSAKIGRFKHMAAFDWDWPKAIERKKIEALLSHDFTGNPENIIFLGAEGLGKTMIAKNMAWNAIHAGKTAVYTTASKLVTELASAGHLFETKVRRYANTDVLVIDELGYLTFENKAADILFEIVSRRYEEKPIILTTNLAFKDWVKIFPGASCVVSLVDRLTQDAKIISIKGPSYRQRNGGSK